MRVRVSGKIFDDKEIDLMKKAVDDGWWTEGRFNEKFEKELAKKLGVEYCVTTNSGSSANLLAISALTSFRLKDKRLKRGDEVITLACGFPTTVNPIIQHNLTPVFIDLEIGTYVPTVGMVKKAITKKTKAIFLPHTLGNPFPVKEIKRICQKRDIWLIEDNCDALGSVYKGKLTGSFGDISTCSFYPAHQITMGEGGAVLTHNPLINRIIISIKDWGRDCWCRPGQDNTCGKRYGWQLGDLPLGYDHKYIYSEIGYNLKITDIQAALGLAQLEKLSAFNKKRKENYQFYKKTLAEFEDYFILPQPTKGADPSWFGFLVTLKDNLPFTRSELLEFLNKKRIDTRLLFAGNLTKQPYFKNYQIKYRISGSLKNTNKVMNDTFWIGVYPGIGVKERQYVYRSFQEFLKMLK